ncbi:MAG TPA: glycosyltransferase [Candidatus Nanoarchaeia archaeon]|nr:glycosyltransferase [Candidatus Nanoarchaeia archaeon]
MISLVITSFNEPKTIGKAIESIINQKIDYDFELIVSAPDDETLNIARIYLKKNKKIRLIQDPGKGKNVAINFLLSHLKGDVIIFTDGDVYTSENSINSVMAEFKDPLIGCVSGRPVPQETRKTQYGFWSHFLFDAAHDLRRSLKEQGKFLECSGYLYGYRNKVLDSVPLHAGDDAIIPHLFWKKGYKIGYAENARVYVKNVDNWRDWIKQKTRTTKSHETLKDYIDVDKRLRMKTFLNEVQGVKHFISYPRNFREYYWAEKLIMARLLMWAKVFYDTQIRNNKYTDNWERVESTK